MLDARLAKSVEAIACRFRTVAHPRRQQPPNRAAWSSIRGAFAQQACIPARPVRQSIADTESRPRRAGDGLRLGGLRRRAPRQRRRRGAAGLPAVRRRPRRRWPRRTCCATSFARSISIRTPAPSLRVRDYTNRDPRLSQQIALRLPGPDEPDSEAHYSIMAADEIAVTSAGPLLGEMTVRGRLLDRQGVRVAAFRQTTRLWRGSRVIELAVDLDIDRPPEADPWDSYYAVRFAWKDPAAAIFRGANMAVAATELRRIESPHFLDIRRAGQRTTLLCGGLPYHRRLGIAKLDTLLVVRGETARSFRLGVGIDVPHPMAAALGFLSPPLVLPDQPPPPIPTGWLFHLDCRNVLATHWEPLFSDATDGADGETDGRPHPAVGNRRPRRRLAFAMLPRRGVGHANPCGRCAADARNGRGRRGDFYHRTASMD